MQWVVTTGRTVEAARDRALDALGIDATELDFEVVTEPSSSLFGLRRTDAKIRARVRPTRPRPKADRRNRTKRRDGRRGKGRDRATRDTSGTGGSTDKGPDDAVMSPVGGTGRGRSSRASAEPIEPANAVETDAAETTELPAPAG
ncbi:MAG: Jag N-terminal domain-containing protein, partial [Acidimicrobiales bacterium]